MSSAMLAALQATQLNCALLVSIEFTTGTVYVWSGIGNLSWNGRTWVGVGSFGGITTVDEGTTVEAKGITLSLSGIDNSLLADANQNLQQGLLVTVYLALFDASGTLIPDPLNVWSGETDQPTVDVGGEGATIAINCENVLLEMGVSCDRRYTHDDQQIGHPGDLGFQFVNGIQEQTIYFGRVPTTTNAV